MNKKLAEIAKEGIEEHKGLTLQLQLGDNKPQSIIIGAKYYILPEIEKELNPIEAVVIAVQVEGLMPLSGMAPTMNVEATFMALDGTLTTYDGSQVAAIDTNLENLLKRAEVMRDELEAAGAFVD